MSLFAKEVANIRNPAFGAALLYGLARGYRVGDEQTHGLPLPIAFIGLPFLLEPEVVDTIRHTKAGIRNVAEKLSANPRAGSDLLRRMPALAKANRKFTVDCILVLLRASLAELHVGSSELRIHNDLSLEKIDGVPREYKEAEKLGGWLAKLSIFEISSLFKVGL